jgi:hypothetical protein
MILLDFKIDKGKDLEIGPFSDYVVLKFMLSVDDLTKQPAALHMSMSQPVRI